MPWNFCLLFIASFVSGSAGCAASVGRQVVGRLQIGWVILPYWVAMLRICGNLEKQNMWVVAWIGEEKQKAAYMLVRLSFLTVEIMNITCVKSELM